jgi:4-alpha-glucanotransferase
MSDDQELTTLAEEAGIAPLWRDVRGETQQVSPETLRSLLHTMGLPTATASQRDETRAALATLHERLPRMLTMTAGPDGCAIPGSHPGTHYRLKREDGSHEEGVLETGWGGEARLPAQHQPGYHRLDLPDGTHCIVAVAPPRCFGLEEAGALRHRGTRCWGLAAQVYGLRRTGDLGIGDVGGLADLGRAAAARGASCIAASPLHALFAADVERFGPYAPSSRLFRNALHADPGLVFPDGEPESDPAREAAELVDWPGAGRAKLARLRRLFELHKDDPRFVEYRSDAGQALEDHARFEALHAHHYGSDPALWHWRHWPEAHRDPRGAGVQAFARDHAEEVAFHSFLQFVADESLCEAQAALREAGMPIGLIADLAVGTDGGGSQAWSRQEEILQGPTVGAPPDFFSPLGQNWGLTAFSPTALRVEGFSAFLEVLRAALRHAGGVRVDHVMGLARLWLVPEGARAAEGAYLTYPLHDLLRLLALESHRHRAIIIGEDLGTLPEGFHGALDAAGVLGMRVLWFQRREDGGFIPPADWDAQAVAMTTTHDLPTAAGWWGSRDIGWRARLNLFPDADSVRQESEQRARDRAELWQAMQGSGAATGDPPPVEDGAGFATAAAIHAAGAACSLALLPLEDALALEEQPNLPGTVQGHPNWQRRLPGEAATLLDAPDVGARLDAFAKARG